VRDGDPAALEGLCERRGPAVLAYCRIVAGDAAAASAAAEAFARFRAAVVAADDLASLNPEALLVSATRHAAAHHASVVASGLCAEVPVLLAGRADHSISPANVEFLEGHLEVCWTCRAPVARFVAAEKAYLDPPDDTVPPDAAQAIVAALVAAAPVRADAGDAPPAETAVAAPAAANGNGNGHHGAPVAGDRDAPTTEHRTVEEEEHAPRRASENGTRRRDTAAPRPTSANGAHGPKDADVPRPRSTSGDPASRRRRRESVGALVAMRGALAAGAARAQRAHRAPPAPRPGSGIYLPRPDRGRSPARGGRRERSAMRSSVVMPVVLVAGAVLVALFVAGVFGSDQPASSPTSVAPRPVAPRPVAPPADTKQPTLVQVPGAGDASAQAVERAKARARRLQAAPNGAAPKPAKPTAATPAPPPAASPPASTPAASTPPAATPAPTPAAGTGGTAAKPKAKAKPTPKPKPPAPRRAKGPRVDAGGGATGVEPQLPRQKSKKVPELTPPAEPTTPPTPQPPG
jgi:hypothetical protein